MSNTNSGGGSTNRYVCIHGHFYQPPRENAWLETVELQETARPWHDWNARINYECYAPNAAARILDEKGQINKIRNNYNRISFNFGPTLLSWMEENDPEAYSLLRFADKRSMERFGGHGSAMAQVHSHLIMPLCNYRDKVTQVYWGIRDFEHRFGRYPEGMWLAETAVNTETLEVLAAQGIQFTVLAPRQAASVRKINTDDKAEWFNVNSETIDTRRAYWCTLPSGRRIALFFYHGGVSQAVAFERLLNSGKGFANRIMSIFDNTDPSPQLAHIATDGESYGHHHRFGEMALADALNYIEDGGYAKLTNYGQFLELCPPEWEVKIHDNSSWSCVHGIERWRADCGCNTGTNLHQRWRKPLRDALDWLRDQLIPIFEREGGRLLRDPWAARNEYMDVILAKRTDAATQQFLKKHALRTLSDIEITTVLRLLEMQRFAVLMYTSCGWFFDEISGIETSQILQYALRALDYASDFGEPLHDEFTKRLSAAPSNVLPNGAVSFLQNVVPTKVTLERVAMHFAVASLFEEKPDELDLFNYTAAVEFMEKIEGGKPRIVGGRLRIRSRLTRMERTFCFAVLYLGQQHIIGNLSEKMNRSAFDEMWSRTAKAFRSAHLGEVIGILQEYFGPEKFTLSSLFTDEKSKIIQEITENSLYSAEANFKSVFDDNYQLMLGLQEANLPVPDAWRNIAAYVLNADLHQFFTDLETPDPNKLRSIAEDIQRWQIKINDIESIQHTIGERIYQEINKLNLDESSLPRVIWLNDVLHLVSTSLKLTPSIWRSQNVFYLLTKGYRKGQWVFANDQWLNAFERMASLLKVRLK